MVCVYCSGDTQVTNSRHQKKANQVWRRRKCLVCSAVFSSTERVEIAQALTVKTNKGLEPFSRDKLFLSIYDTLKHRKTALRDATSLTATIISRLYTKIDNPIVERANIVEATSLTLKRFDKAALTAYKAFHPI